VFATDTAHIKPTFKGINYVMVECNYSLDILKKNVEEGTLSGSQKNRILKSHFGLDNVVDFLKANDLSSVREIHLLHLSSGNSNAEYFKRTIEGLTGKPVYVAVE
jgi:phosphoribosyl 1,2-cyclic phosphodiesterase